MRARSLLATLVCLVAVAAFPATGIAQTAGQAEYGGVAAVQETSPPAATPPAAGVAAETAESTPAESTPAPSGPEAAVAADTSDGTLPFTGRDLLLMLVAGLGLVGVGVALRTVTRAPAGA